MPSWQNILLIWIYFDYLSNISKWSIHCTHEEKIHNKQIEFVLEYENKFSLKNKQTNKQLKNESADIGGGGRTEEEEKKLWQKWSCLPVLRTVYLQVTLLIDCGKSISHLQKFAIKMFYFDWSIHPLLLSQKHYIWGLMMHCDRKYYFCLSAGKYKPQSVSLRPVGVGGREGGEGEYDAPPQISQKVHW